MHRHQGDFTNNLGKTASISLKTIYLSVIGIVIMFPIFWLFLVSFKSGRTFLDSPYGLIFLPTLQNYVNTFSGSIRGITISHVNFFNSLIIAASTTCLCIIFGAPAAFSVARLRFRAAKPIFIITLVLRMTPPIIIALPLYFAIRRVGLIDTKIAVILSHLGIELPFVIWLLRSFYNGIPYEIEEASIIDGCSPWQRFLRISSPLIMPGLATSAILVLINSWNEFLMALILTREKSKPLSVAISQLDTQYETLTSQIYASGVVAVLPVILVAFLAQRYLVRGLTLGAIK